MSERPVNLLLDDIREAIERAERYIAGMSFATFAHDEKTIDAVVRNLEIIWQILHRDLPSLQASIQRIRP